MCCIGWYTQSIVYPILIKVIDSRDKQVGETPHSTTIMIGRERTFPPRNTDEFIWLQICRTGLGRALVRGIQELIAPSRAMKARYNYHGGSMA